MPEPKDGLFRQESLEKLSSPERLDELMEVVNPRAWLSLTTIGALIVATLIWSILGKIPLNISGTGVLIQPRRLVQLQSSTQGQVLEIYIKPNSILKKNQIIATVDQSALKKQLQQQQEKLAQLQGQNRQTTELQKERIALEKQNLIAQRMNLERSLQREKISLDLRQKNLDSLVNLRKNYQNILDEFPQIAQDVEEKTFQAIQAKENSLKSQIQQYEELLPKLKQRSMNIKNLLDKNLITEDVYLTAERDYYSSLTQKSEIETQLKQIRLDRANTQEKKLQNRDRVRDLENQIKDTDVKILNVEREYRQSLNMIDDFKIKIQGIQVEEAKLNQQEKESLIDKTNNIAEVKRGIAELQKSILDKSEILSPYEGKVLEVNIVSGQVINAGSRIASLATKKPDSSLVGIAYFPDKDGKQIQKGMQVQITPSMIKRERYGGILGKVTEVSPFSVTTEDIATIVGNPELAQSLSGQQPRIQVIAELERDSNNINNGYKWSSSKGPVLELSGGTTAQIQIQVGERRPISYVIPILRSLTGLN
ncbi:MAG: NHLP bacteriocin system secretion protein [Microcystis aeruginosa F13-15]|nr:NHLP bacteriocin system secretion protein [Microcystis aeruginosa F13-15]